MILSNLYFVLPGLKPFRIIATFLHIFLRAVNLECVARTIFYYSGPACWVSIILLTYPFKKQIHFPGTRVRFCFMDLNIESYIRLLPGS